MSRYTLELRKIVESNNMVVFDFEYDFYVDDVGLRENFENKFCDYYYFNEIGFETVARFKHFLKSELNLKMDYYKQLYETELKSKNIEFLLNKDLKETFVRDIENKISSTTNSKNENLGVNFTENENRFHDTPQSKLKSIDKYLTTLNKDNSKSGDMMKGISEVDNLNNLNGKEITELVSKGNIGTTSSAQLLRDWRDVLINIDELLIKDLNDLFLKIY
ncbi:MAG: hypothetical protein ACRCX2_33405 [Paraclostridium sp.]